MNKIKTISVFAIFLTILPVSVLALQQTVNKIVIYVEPGGSNSTYYGLINEKNETTIAKLRTEGSISEFVTIPGTLELLPGKMVQVYVNVSIPDDYDFSKGRNITGYVYSLVEGQSGQVKINVQARKPIQIIVTGGNENIFSEIKDKLPISGFVALISNPIVSFAVGIVIASIVFFMVKGKTKKKKEVKKH